MDSIMSQGYGLIPKALMRSDIGAYSKLVMAYLLSYTGAGKNQAWPSIATMSKDLHISKPTVIKAIKGCQDGGLLEKSKKDPTRYDSVNVYTLTFEVVKEVDHPSKGGLLPVVKEVDSNINNTTVTKNIPKTLNKLTNDSLKSLLKESTKLDKKLYVKFNEAWKRLDVSPSATGIEKPMMADFLRTWEQSGEVFTHKWGFPKDANFLQAFMEMRNDMLVCMESQKYKDIRTGKMCNGIPYTGNYTEYLGIVAGQHAN